MGAHMDSERKPKALVVIRETPGGFIVQCQVWTPVPDTAEDPDDETADTPVDGPAA